MRKGHRESQRAEVKKIERDLLFPEEVRRQGIKMSGQKVLESIQEQYRKLEKTVEIFREN